MGINNHLLNFLKYASKRNAIFGKTATIGRQKLMARNQHIQKTLNFEKKEDIPKKGDFCENLLLSHFGSEKVDSFDNSDYEGATITCDLNKPLPSHLSGPEYQYDTIIDAGTLEHIFNIPQAFKNISNMCKIGGTIIMDFLQIIIADMVFGNYLLNYFFPFIRKIMDTLKQKFFLQVLKMKNIGIKLRNLRKV